MNQVLPSFKSLSPNSPPITILDSGWKCRPTGTICLFVSVGGKNLYFQTLTELSMEEVGRWEKHTCTIPPVSLSNTYETNCDSPGVSSKRKKEAIITPPGWAFAPQVSCSPGIRLADSLRNLTFRSLSFSSLAWLVYLCVCCLTMACRLKEEVTHCLCSSQPRTWILRDHTFSPKSFRDREVKKERMIGKCHGFPA